MNLSSVLSGSYSWYSVLRFQSLTFTFPRTLLVNVARLLSLSLLAPLNLLLKGIVHVGTCKFQSLSSSLSFVKLFYRTNMSLLLLFLIASAVWEGRWNFGVPADDSWLEGKAAFSTAGLGQKQHSGLAAGLFKNRDETISFVDTHFWLSSPAIVVHWMQVIV